MKFTRATLLALILGPATAPVACVPTNPDQAMPPPKVPSLAAREPVAPARIEETALMNHGDEVDDNIWTRRPRNRLQPGQTAAPPMAARKADGAKTKPSNEPAPESLPTAGTVGVAPAAESTPTAGANGAAPARENAPATGTNATAPAPKATSPVAALPAPAPLPPAPRPQVAAARGSLPTAKPSEAAESDDAGGTAAGKPVWSIALATFGGDDHRLTAEGACRLFTQQVPELKGAFVRSTPSGSVVMWGEFDGPKDPRAKPTIERLRQVTIGDGRPFAKAMLTRLEQFSEQEMHPWDLRQVRRLNPKVRVIYTLQVAAWSDLGSGTLSFDEIRRSAESYCRQLRAEGVEAWFHHDADLRTSIVTVGIFDHRAYDPQSTLFAPEVEVMRKRFPKSLLNGEELLIKPDPARPDFAVPQASRLVEVPR